jgi:hypothetical protein
MDFNTEEYLGTRTVYKTDKIHAGMFIKVYAIDIMKPDAEPVLYRKGTIIAVDPLMIKYAYYNADKKDVATGFLHVDDVDKTTYELGEDQQMNSTAYRFVVSGDIG